MTAAKPLLRLNPSDDVTVRLEVAIGGSCNAPTLDPPWRVAVGVDGYHAPRCSDRSRENVFLIIYFRDGSICDSITPAQARELAQALLDASLLAEDNRDRREAYESIQEDFASADALAGDEGVPSAAATCRYGHPDVHYVPQGHLLEALRELGERRGIVLVQQP